MRKSSWQGLLLLLLGLGLSGSVWYGINAWLRPKPLWVYQPVEEPPKTLYMGIDCVSSDGRWMLVSDQEQGSQQPVHRVILDRQTGQPVPGIDFSRIIWACNYGYIHCPQVYTLAKDCLWWFSHRIEGAEVVIQFKCLPFLTSKQEINIHSWRLPVHTRGYIRCVETDEVHAVLHLKTELEPALHALMGLTQDGLTLLPYYYTAWSSMNYCESWSVTGAGSDIQCQKKAQYVLGDLDECLARSPIDQQGIAYSLWTKLRADNLVTGEPLGQFHLPSRDHYSGQPYLRGDLFYFRRYFLYLDPLRGNEGTFDPRDFLKHPQATFYDYGFLFDKTTHQPVSWPTDMHRDCLVDDELLVAAEHPDKLLLMYKQPGSVNSSNNERQLDFMTRQGDSLRREHSLQINHAKAVAYSPDAEHIYVDRVRYRQALYPRFTQLATSVRWFQKLLDFLPEYQGSMDVLSAQTGETLFSLPDAYFHFDDSDLCQTTLAQHQLILLRSNTPNRFPLQGYALECWQAPFVIHSPWWGRGMALVVLLIYGGWYFVYNNRTMYIVGKGETPHGAVSDG